MAQIHTFEFMQAEVNDLKAEIERLTKWNHDRLEELKERDIEVERLRAALKDAADQFDAIAIHHAIDRAVNGAATIRRILNEQLTK